MDLNQIKAVVFDLEGTLLDRVKSREKFIEEIGRASCRERVCQYV